MDKKTLKTVLMRHQEWLENLDSKGPKQPGRAILKNANFKGADLSKVNLRMASLLKANFSEAHFRGADLSETDLRGAVLRGTNLYKASLRKALLLKADLRLADVRRANLNKASLRAADLRRADLSEANLSRANFSGADLTGANLTWAELTGSNLTGANFSGADLSGADLREANLTGTNLSGVDLSGADLREAKIVDVELRDADLRGVVLTSRRALDDLMFPISEDQLTGIIFEDEKNQAKESRQKQGKEEKGEFSRLIVRLDAPGITPFNFSMLLVSIEATYNNIFYLLNTEETSLGDIERHLQPYYQGMEAENQLQIGSISEGSIDITFESLGKGVAEIISAVGNIGANLLKEIRKFREQNHRHEQEILDKELERKVTEAETDGILLKNEKQRLKNQLLKLDIVNESGATAKSLVSLTPSEAAFSSALVEDEIPELGNLLNNSKNPVVVTYSLELQKHCIEPMASTFTKLSRYEYPIDIKYVDSKDDINTD